MAEASGAQLARDEPGQDDRGRAGQRRQDPEPDERFAEKEPRKAGDERGQGRMVDIPEGQPFPTDDVVELVSKIAVAPGECQMGGELGQPQIKEDGRRSQERRPRKPLFHRPSFFVVTPKS